MTTTLPAGWKPRLSCPFCGSNFLFTEPDEYGSGGQWVSPIHVGCNDCKAEQVGDTEDEAVSRWNARFTPPATTQDAPITVSLDSDPRGVSVGVWQGSHCIYNGAHAVPVSAQDDAKDILADVMAALDRMCTPLDPSLLKGATAEADARCMQTIRDYILRPAPAAGDARLLEFVREVAQQKPEKPDYWSSCGQCASNSSQASDLLDVAASQQQEG